jgi:two-component system CheB/CheR fusion protein
LLAHPAESGALRASEERLQLALHAGHSGVWDWDMSRDVADVSPSYRELFGLPPGAPVSYDVWLAHLHPEDRSRCRAYSEAFFAGRETEWRLEFRICTPHMGVRWHRAIGRVYRDEAGKPLRFIGVSTDVTEEQRALAALRESEERFRAMADGLPLIVWVHDENGQQQFVNRTFLDFFGVTEAEMKGERWQLLMHPDDAAAYTAEFLACTRERRPFHAEVRVKDAQGEWRTIESWARPRFSAAGEFLGMVGSSADVTERRRAEQALREADRRKDEFLATLGHELRNPLAAIAAAMEIFRRALPDDPAIQQVRASAERQAAILRRLVDDLLDSARISTGKIELQRKPLTMQDVLHAALDTSRPYISARKHQLVIEQTGEPLVISGDELRLVQALSNLLNNAARYTPEHGRIQVTLERSGSHAVVRVRDNGIGIAPDMLEAVFGLFVQGGSPASRAGRGLGLGLTLVKRLVELHGGSVAAHSEGSGRGSEFVVRLPLAPDVALPASRPASAAAPARAPRRILVVDDNVDGATVLASLLSRLGHEVQQAHDGRAALEKAAAFRPEVIILDIDLPDMDGHEVARRLRAAEAGRTARIVAASGFVARGGEDAPGGLFDRYFVKPLDVAELEAML